MTGANGTTEPSMLAWALQAPHGPRPENQTVLV